MNEFIRNITDYMSSIAEEHDAISAINGDYYGFRSDGLLIRNGVVYRDAGVRSGAAFYVNGSMEVYDETETDAQTLLDEGVINTASFGPILVEEGIAVSDLGKVSIEPGHYIFIVVDGRQDGYSRGVKLEEFARAFEDLCCTSAYNLDGGGSSTMYYMGEVVDSPCNRNCSERATSDILCFTELD